MVELTVELVSYVRMFKSGTCGFNSSFATCGS
jgi:hypothetical protein